MTARTPAELLRDEADMIAAGAQLQMQGLDLLLAEMRALANLIPGTQGEQADDTKIEQGFDNMPV